MQSTGPKISSRAIVMSLRTSANTVGFDEIAFVHPLGTSEPTSNHLCAFVDALFDQALHFFELRSAGQGANVVPSANGSPTLVASAACSAAAIACAILDRGTSIRVGALQDWPVLRKHACTPCLTALSRSASSRIMWADLPPSSCVTRFTVGAAATATAMPARVDPVKETMATSGCEEIAAAHGGAIAIHQIEDAGRKIRLHREFGRTR